MPNNQAPPPPVLLLVAPTCPHCEAVLQNLAKLVKQGAIGRLDVVNIAIHPEVAEEVGTRSVPWMRIGRVELTGAYSLGEIQEWIEKSSNQKSAEYIAHLLETNRLEEATLEVSDNAELLSDVINLMTDDETPFSVRIGIGAIIEELAGSETLEKNSHLLIDLTESEERQVRSDAAHYLAFTRGSDEVRNRLRSLSESHDEELAEIARESLEELEA